MIVNENIDIIHSYFKDNSAYDVVLNSNSYLYVIHWDYYQVRDQSTCIPDKFTVKICYVSIKNDWSPHNTSICNFYNIFWLLWWFDGNWRTSSSFQANLQYILDGTDVHNTVKLLYSIRGRSCRAGRLFLEYYWRLHSLTTLCSLCLRSLLVFLIPILPFLTCWRVLTLKCWGFLGPDYCPLSIFSCRQ